MVVLGRVTGMAGSFGRGDENLTLAAPVKSSMRSPTLVRMWTDIGADAYARFMGLYAEPLADEFVALADPQPRAARARRGVRAGDADGEAGRAAGRAGRGSAWTRRSPSWTPRAGAAPGSTYGGRGREELPFEDGAFDVALAQLVVHFMDDPVAGLREMGRMGGAGEPGRLPACGTSG